MAKDFNYYVAQVAGTLVLTAAAAAAQAETASEQLAAKDTEIAALKARIADLEKPKDA